MHYSLVKNQTVLARLFTGIINDIKLKKSAIILPEEYNRRSTVLFDLSCFLDIMNLVSILTAANWIELVGKSTFSSPHSPAGHEYN